MPRVGWWSLAPWPPAHNGAQQRQPAPRLSAIVGTSAREGFACHRRQTTVPHSRQHAFCRFRKNLRRIQPEPTLFDPLLLRRFRCLADRTALAEVDLATEGHQVGGWQHARNNPDNLDAYRPLAHELIDEFGHIDVLLCSGGYRRPFGRGGARGA